MKNEFKAGDLVFEVSDIEGVSLTEVATFDNKTYSIKGNSGLYTANGQGFDNFKSVPSLFHATPENRQALVTLYGEDAVPKIPLRGSELTRKLLERQKYAMCYCCDTSDDDCRKNKNIRIITCFKGGYFYSGKVDSPFVATWKYAVPVDNNGNEITEIEE